MKPTYGPARLAVVGTLVWDTIFGRDQGRMKVQEWGGIGYALEALEAALPDGWEVVPAVKVGRDLAERALHFLGELPRVDPEGGVRVVPEPTNRVELRYEGGNRRTERISGGVPPWSWAELAPLVERADAVYANFISGFEMNLDTARLLRAAYRGPIYADLHSLFLGVGRGGLRIPRTLPARDAWLRCFDAVQMNEHEFELLGGGETDPWMLAAAAVGHELKLVTVTLGPRGAAAVASPALCPDPAGWADSRDGLAAVGPARSWRVPQEGPPAEGDPIGCGDVWGSTFFARLLAGDGLEEAMATANRQAARAVQHRGARGLRHHLGGRLEPRGEGR